MNHLDNWNKLARPPENALKTIQAGRLKGKSDINPQWRYKAMTEVYGPCGEGWKFDVVKLWTEPGPAGQMFAFAIVNLYTLHPKDEDWNAPIPGVGGHFLTVQESNGLHANDEAFKMAVTDALGTAMKMLGVAADVYAGLWDGAKYKEPGSRWEGQFEPHGGQPKQPTPSTPKSPAAPAPAPGGPTVCPKCGGPTWDNRAKKASGEYAANRPDFSCRDKNCKGAIWPPKAAAPRQREPGEDPPDRDPQDPGFDPNDDLPFSAG